MFSRQHNITFKDDNVLSMEKEKEKEKEKEGLDSNQPKHVMWPYKIPFPKYLEKEFLSICINYGFIPNKSKIFVTAYIQGEMSAISSFIKIGDFNASHSIGLAEFI